MDNEHWLRDSKAARRAGVSRMTWWRWGKDGKRPGRLSLHVFVHALVWAVLLRTRRADSLMNDPELHPPDIEFAQPVDAR